jgi:hypothetical protein
LSTFVSIDVQVLQVAAAARVGRGSAMEPHCVIVLQLLVGWLRLAEVPAVLEISLQSEEPTCLQVLLNVVASVMLCLHGCFLRRDEHMVRLVTVGCTTHYEKSVLQVAVAPLMQVAVAALFEAATAAAAVCVVN